MPALRLAAVALLAAATLAAGCLKRSKVARIYVLDSLAATEAAPSVAPVAVVGVERVRVPDWLDRPQVTGRAATGEVVVDEFSRWGEPLPRGAQRVLAESLAVLLPDRRVVSAPFSPRDRVDHSVEITLLEAARQADGSVLLDCRWAVLGKDGAVLARRRSSHRAEPTAPGPAGAVAGLNEALASLSRELAGVLRAQPAPEAGGPANP
jgi:uncharacterized protein